MRIHEHAAQGNIPGLIEERNAGTSLNLLDDQGLTPLMVAIISPTADCAVLQWLLEHGANLHAIEQHPQHPRGSTVLTLAAKHASYEKIKFLIGVGADVTATDAKGYTVLLSALFRWFREPLDQTLTLLNYLIDYGASLDATSSYGESPVGVTSVRGQFAKLKLLLHRGADPQRIGWNSLFHAAAFGTPQDIETVLQSGADLHQRDPWNRTPFLIAVHAGRIENAQYLLKRHSNRSAVGRTGQTPILYAIGQCDAAMLRWLIAQGFDVEQSDDSGDFPLQEAVIKDDAACIAALLDAGASPSRKRERDRGIMTCASSPQVVDLLRRAGEDITELGSAMRSRLACIDVPNEVDLAFSESDYRNHRHRQFGDHNPTRMNNPFWDYMVRSRIGARGIAHRFGDPYRGRDPVWCFSRFGQSFTQLPDGRYVEIAGEHEDSYDPDFCIYNDVVVYDGQGGFGLYGYPEYIFPPTDFHSATVFKEHIYIIGSLGYKNDRRPGTTPIFRLNCRNWEITAITSYGDNPGWISRHRAAFISPDTLKITGGQICTQTNPESRAELIDNPDTFLLNLHTMTWTRQQTSG